LPLPAECADVFNRHVEWALTARTYSKAKAHHALYEEQRSLHPTVPSALIQTVRDTALEAIKATAFAKRPRKKPTSGLRYDRRTFTLRGAQITLSCIGPRVRAVLHVPEYFRTIYDTCACKSAMLTYSRGSRQFWVRLVFEAPDPPRQEGASAEAATIGIDRGLYHLAVTSTGQTYSNSHVRAVQRRYLHNRKTLQAQGTKSAKRRLRRQSGCEQRFSQSVNHVVTKAIAHLPAAMFVLEDLSGIRAQRRGKKINKWLGSWPFSQFAFFLTYKAEALGKRVVYVDPRYTSQKCSRCKRRSSAYRYKSRFRCGSCGYRAHADLNAAYNIRDDYILSSTPHASEEQAAVNRPYVSPLGHGAERVGTSRTPRGAVVDVDFNTMMMDPEERIYIGKEGSAQDDQDMLSVLRPGTPVVLHDGEMQVEATIEYDGERKIWFGKPDWATRRDTAPMKQEAATL